MWSPYLPLVAVLGTQRFTTGVLHVMCLVGTFGLAQVTAARRATVLKKDLVAAPAIVDSQIVRVVTMHVFTE
jgi:hypothetical protein